ncbi:peptidoglycan-binding domain-containing protein [Micromonospora sp. NPDC049107]|uniref:peptidoglycan-binding domain-containing protein n=1 Tax=Micromonospora sp. NPDC049107 TaxID=3154349 RepID=UPI0033D83992
MKLRSFASATATIVALTGGMTAFASPVNASVSQGYIKGIDSINDDWGDEGVLSTTSHSYSLATGLWQQVLKGEGLYSGSVDCAFGPMTKSATEAFQSRYHLPIDGAAGPQTMGRADDFLKLGTTDTYIDYDRGINGGAWFRRIDSTYHLYLNGAWRPASYSSTAGC